MISINGQSIAEACTNGVSVAEIYNNGVKVWPMSSTSSIYYIKWTPTDVEGSFIMNNGETKWFDDYNGFYTGPFYFSYNGEITSRIKMCFLDSVAFKSTGITNVWTNCEYISTAAFKECTSLTYADLRCIVLGEQVFSSCTSLFRVELPNCQLIHFAAFDGCTSLTYVSLPNVERINYYAFYNCTSLNDVYLPNCYFIGDCVFGHCSNLSTITLGYSGGVVSFGGSPFSSTPLYWGSGTIYVPRDLVASYEQAYPSYSSIFKRIPNQ
jgi:hypothetical protein